MNTVVVLTLGDIVGLTILGLIVLGVGFLFLRAVFLDWKNSPKRWWNKDKRRK